MPTVSSTRAVIRLSLAPPQTENRRIVKRTAAWLAGLAAWLLIAGAALGQSTWVENDAAGNVRVHLYFFWSQSCHHCEAARPFVEGIARERPWVIVHSLEVSHNRDNAQRFVDLAQSLGQAAEVVPTFIACAHMDVGWDGADRTGAALLQRLDSCRMQAQSGTSPAAAPAIAAPNELHLPLFGDMAADSLSLPVLTLVLAGLDAFNPCAFFVLLFLLSLLAHQKDRRRMFAIGAVFVLTSGLMYFAFMAAWLNLFQILGALTWITVAAGVVAIVIGLINVKDFFAFGRGVTLSIPESRKPDIYRRARAILGAENIAAMLAATAVLAIAANLYELLCTAGFPMVYTRVLSMNELSAAARYAFLGLYNLIYVIPLAAIVLAFIGTLGARKLSEREGRLLKLMSGVMMLGLGVMLVLAPQRLNSLAASATLLAVAVGITAIAARLTRKARPSS